MAPVNQGTPFDALALALSKRPFSGPGDAADAALLAAEPSYGQGCIIEFDRLGRNLVRLDARGAYVTRSALLASWRGKLATARAALANAVSAQAPDRHFRGLPECPRVIAAYDAVRDAEKAVARLDLEGRR